jgi:hypothetical protein
MKFHGISRDIINVMKSHGNPWNPMNFHGIPWNFMKFIDFLGSSARLGSARLGSARLGSARLGSARLGSARLGSAHPGSARLGSARNSWTPSLLARAPAAASVHPTAADSPTSRMGRTADPEMDLPACQRTSTRYLPISFRCARTTSVSGSDGQNNQG